MPILFQSRPGAVVRLDDAALQCTTRFFSVANPRLSFETEKSIITRLAVNEQTNVQFLHTLGAQIFIYVFGDRIGTINLSGLSFSCACPEGSGQGGLNGAENMYSWYKRHRVSKRRLPVRIMLGNTPIEGFVVGFSEDVVDPSLQLVQWGVNLMTLPEDAGGPGDQDAPVMPIAIN